MQVSLFTGSRFNRTFEIPDTWVEKNGLPKILELQEGIWIWDESKGYKNPEYLRILPLEIYKPEGMTQ